MPDRTRRLAHGWRLIDHTAAAEETIRQFLRPAVRAVPGVLARRLGPCEIRLLPAPARKEWTSRWTARTEGLLVELAAVGVEPHDLALELLLCLGQAAWDASSPEEQAAYFRLLEAEIRAGVPGEMDEDPLREKRLLLSSRRLARSRRALERYARASFAATMAEYVHALWHDVTVRTGPEHLSPPWLRRRLQFLARQFPPDRGHRLFARRQAP